MRTDNSKKNLLSGISVTLLMTLLGFFTRRVFVDSVGLEYLGLNGLLTNMLAVVSLLEGGIGTSIVYNLYKPLAAGDRERVVALVQLYRRLYRYIAGGIVAMGLCIYPFLGVFIKDGEGLRHLTPVFAIFLFNSVVPYFSAYRWGLVNADQRLWKLTGLNVAYQVGLSLAKLAVLWWTGNYIAYLVVESLFGLGYNMAVVRRVGRLYPWIRTRVRHSVEPQVRRTITANSGALFLHALGGWLAHSTDNIVISSLVSVSAVGLYSNYTLITGYVGTFTTQVLGSFSESVGNLVASESRDRVHAVFRTVFLVNFLVVSIPVIVLANIIGPFIAWWLGAEYVLDTATVVVILTNLYIFGMRSSALTFKVKSGIFRQDRFSPLIQGAVNLVLSLLLVRRWGIAGVLAATTVSVLAVGFWQYPRLVYKYTFGRPLRDYFARWGGYTALAAVALVASRGVCGVVGGVGVWAIVARGAVSVAVPAVVYGVVLWRTAEMRALVRDYLSKSFQKR